jgi:type II secretory pathway pseudopilin PulG
MRARSKKNNVADSKSLLHQQSGFSLVEIVVAMGILTFALVSLLALFPVALETAAESKAETRITQIAQSVYADLKASSLASASIVTGPDLQTDLRQSIDLSVATTLYLSYRADGSCVGTLVESDYKNGVSGKGDYLVKVQSTPLTTGTVPTLSKLTLSVESPIQAEEIKRDKVSFVTLKAP